MTTTSSRMLDAALEYAAMNWSVIPLHTPTAENTCSCRDKDRCQNVGKHPRTQNGLKDATTDPETIARWWTQWPKANIGIECGRSSIVVLDVDVRHGGDEAWEDLVTIHGADWRCRSRRTPQAYPR